MHKFVLYLPILVGEIERNKKVNQIIIITITIGLKGL